MTQNLVLPETDLRERAYSAFKNICQYNISPNGDAIPDIRLYDYLDADLINRLRSEGFIIPQFMLEQSRHMHTALALSDLSTQFRDLIVGDSSRGVTPYSLLFTFLYDYELIDSLIREQLVFDKPNSTSANPKGFFSITDSLVSDYYGHSHKEMKKNVLEFLSKNNKSKRWKKNQSFDLSEIIDIRQEFFDTYSVSSKSFDRHVMAIYAQKGGTGKSHITLSLAGALSLGLNKNNKVLVIDTDYQRSSTEVLQSTSQFYKDGYQKTVFDLLIKQSELEPTVESLNAFKSECFKAVVESELPNVDLLPAGEFSTIDTRYEISSGSGSKNLRPDSLRSIIDNICEFKKYDYILIDTRPDAGTTAALSYFACDQQIAVYKPTGIDYNAFVNFSKRMAIEVIPKLIPRDCNNYKSPKNNLVVINQYQQNISDVNQMVSIMDLGLESSSIMSRSQVMISNSTATTKCGAQESTIWNPAKGTIQPKPLKDHRRQFIQLAFEIIESQKGGE